VKKKERSSYAHPTRGERQNSVDWGHYATDRKPGIKTKIRPRSHDSFLVENILQKAGPRALARGHPSADEKVTETENWDGVAWGGWVSL